MDLILKMYFLVSYQLYGEMINLKIREMTISHTSYKWRQKEIEKKTIQRKTENYERSQNLKFERYFAKQATIY